MKMFERRKLRQENDILGRRFRAWCYFDTVTDDNWPEYRDLMVKVLAGGQALDMGKKRVDAESMTEVIRAFDAIDPLQMQMGEDKINEVRNILLAMWEREINRK